MKKSLLLLALCAFAAQLAAADMPAICEEYKKVSYDFIDEMAKRAKANGEEFNAADAKKEFDADYDKIRKVDKSEREAACKDGLETVKEIIKELKKAGLLK